MQKKIKNWYGFYVDENWVSKNVPDQNEFDYSKVSSLEFFTEGHPQVMKDRIARKNWKFDYDISKRNYTTKEKVKRLISNLIRHRIGEYKNYKMI